MPLLEIKNLVTAFHTPAGRVPAVDGVSLSIDRGRTLGLVGESGCGKTTVGRSVLRLVEPTGGSVRFAGHDVRAIGGGELRTLRRRMQIVFQDPQSSLDPRMRVRDLITEPLVIAGKPMEGVAERLVDHVGLPRDALGNLPHEFSGGQRQRIAIARALAASPQLLVLDEPTSALDLSVQAQILNLLLDLQREHGFGYLFISHDMAVVRHLADDIAVMCRGRIVEQGATAEVLDAPQHEYTKELMRSAMSGQTSGAVEPLTS